MGLDIVELVMEVEAAFDIAIDDRDAERILTVGDLFRYVLEKLELRDRVAHPCVSGAIFYRLRRALIDATGLDRRLVRPSARVESLVPVDRRHATWGALRRALGLNLPALRFPTGLAGAILLAIPTGLATTVVMYEARTGHRLGHPASVLMGLLLACVPFLIAAYRLAAPFATVLPSESATVRGLVGAIVRDNYGRLGLRDASPEQDREVIRDALRSIIVAQLGVSPDEVSDNARIVDDLGAD